MTVTTSDRSYNWSGLAEEYGITDTILIPRLNQLGHDAGADDADALQKLADAGFEFLGTNECGDPVFRGPPRPTSRMRQILNL